MTFHGRPRYTKDIDLWVSNEPENLRRIYRALARFGAPPNILEDLKTLRPDEILFMGVPVVVLSLEDLIVSKRAAGRPQDLVDAEALDKLR